MIIDIRIFKKKEDIISELLDHQSYDDYVDSLKDEDEKVLGSTNMNPYFYSRRRNSKGDNKYNYNI